MTIAKAMPSIVFMRTMNNGRSVAKIACKWNCQQLCCYCPCSATVQMEEDQMTNMNAEVDAGVNFLTCLLGKSQLTEESVTMFRTNFTNLLIQHYKGHWYPSEPLKGSGYRCLRLNGIVPPLFVEAVRSCDIPLEKVRCAFPSSLTLWIDPGCVYIRIGEFGSIGVIYSKIDWHLTSNKSSTTHAITKSAEAKFQASTRFVEKPCSDVACVKQTKPDSDSSGDWRTFNGWKTTDDISCGKTVLNEFSKCKATSSNFVRC